MPKSFIPDLFNDSVNITYIILGLTTAIIPTIWELKKDAGTRSNPSRKKFTNAGKVYIAGIVFTLVIASTKYRLDDRSQQTLITGNARLLEGHKSDSIAILLSEERQRHRLDTGELHYKLALSVAKDSITKSLMKTETHLKEDAVVNKEDIKHKMDSIRERQLPNIDFALGNSLNFTQSHDTTFFNITIANFSHSAAERVSFETYYLVLDNNNILYEYPRSIWNMKNITIAGDTHISTVPGNVFLAPFKFDLNLPKQFIFIIGSYFNDDPKNEIRKQFFIAQVWDKNINDWVYCPAEDIAALHSKHIDKK